MKRIDQATVQRILDTAEIVDVVSDFVSLKRRGANYIGLCPFHNERTPSFSVSPSKGICKCFSCGKGGSPVNFLMELEKMSFQDALRYLAKKYNIEIQEREMSDQERQEESERESMLAVNEWALQYFERTMRDTPDGRDIGMAYFAQRGISEAMMNKFRLGYCTESRDDMYKAAVKAGYTEKYLIATGLCSKPEGGGGRVFDRFRGRVIYPVFSVSGKVVAFGGRVLKNDKKLAKYVNSPESLIYVKSNQLYGLYQAKSSIVNKDKVYLVEGYMDVISMCQSGVENVVASSGTSLTIGQIRLLRRFSKNVTVIYDSDAAGIKASLRGIDLLLAEGLDVKVLQFPDGDDPDSYAQAHTSEELDRYLAENEVDFIAFKTRILLSGAERDPIKRASAISDICRSIAVIPELIKRTVYIGETSRVLGIDEQVLALQVAKNMADNAAREREESQRQGGHSDLDKMMAEEEESRRAARQTAGQSGTVSQGGASQQGSDPAAGEDAARKDGGAQSGAADDDAFVRYLEPYEKEVLRYVLRYGMSSLNYIDEETGDPLPLTVLDYVRQEMRLDEISFASPVVSRTFNAAVELVAGSWEGDYAAFLVSLDERVRQWRSDGDAEIRSRLGQITDLQRETKKLESEIDERRQKALDEYKCAYIARVLISSADDDVRRLTTELVSDKYVLSAMHTRYAPLPSEFDRRDEFVLRAVYEWKDAILDVEIQKVNDALRDACGAFEGDDMEPIRELMKRKNSLLSLKRDFAQTLGERIIAPRRVK